MDPIANLKKQLDIARRIQAIEDADMSTGDAEAEMGQLATRLAELVLALDEWMRKGGFSPYTQKGDVTA